MTGIRECILYRDFEQGELLEKMTMLMEDISHPKVLYGKDGEYFACIHQLVEMAGAYGFAGNLWHDGEDLSVGGQQSDHRLSEYQ